MRDSAFRHRWILTLAFLTLAAFLSARLAGVLLARRLWMPEVEPAAALIRARAATPPVRLADYRVIEERNLFNANPKKPVAAKASEPVRRAGPAPQARPVSLPPLGIKLVGTAVLEGGRSFALVQSGSEVRIVLEGDEVAEGAVLRKVLPDRIRVARGGTTEEILLFQTAEEAASARAEAAAGRRAAAQETAADDTVQRVTDDKWVIDRREIEQAQANISRLLTQVRVVPNFTNGQPDGFKVFAIRPGSLFAKIGLQNGDVIKRINGVEIQGPDQAFEAYQRLKDETTIQIDLVRRNQNRTFTYEIR